WFIWDAALPPDFPAGPSAALPGAVVGPVLSPVDAACGQLVACGSGAVILLDVAAADGTRLRGRALSEQTWTGLRWDGPVVRGEGGEHD
ncbi:MAG: hypothetical protein ACREME_00770, partial [Gemmatimonadales bacterium]